MYENTYKCPGMGKVNVHPQMMSNIINAINGVFRKVVVDFIVSFVNLQNQIDDMKKTTDEAMQTSNAI